MNQAIEDLICNQFGDETWERIKAGAKVDIPVFISNAPYPDEITFWLVVAASDVLDTPAENILEDFGEYCRMQMFSSCILMGSYAERRQCGGLGCEQAHGSGLVLGRLL